MGENIGDEKKLKIELKKLQKAYELCKDSNEKLNMIIKNTPERILILDRSAKIIFINRVEPGWKADDVIGTSALDFIHPQDKQTFKIALDEVFQSGTQQEFLGKILRRDSSEAWYESKLAPIKKRGEIDEVIILAQNITIRKEAQEALAESEKRYRELINNSHVGVYISTIKGDFLFVNQAMTEIFEFESTHQMIKEGVLARYTKKAERARLIAKLKKSGRIDAYELESKTKLGKIITISISATLDGDIFTGFILDITKRKKAEMALIEKEEFNFALFQHSPIDTIVVDREGRIIRSNLKRRKDKGRIPPIGAVMYKDYAAKHKIDMYKKLMSCIKTGKTKLFTNLEYGDKILEIMMASFSKGAIITCQNISEQKKAEQHIKQSLQEKEVMLKEIHHRVKNNMQIISSLLRLQSQHFEDDNIREIFNLSRNRIKSMALIHDSLYKSEDLAKIDFSDYLQKIATHLLAAYRIDSVSIKPEYELESVFLDINKAVPCGLLVNEIITNSILHGFQQEEISQKRPKEDNRIYISLKKVQGGKTQIIIRDTGVGFPEDIDHKKPETLGLQLIRDLAKQLEGTIKLDRNNGTTWTIKF